MRKIGLFLVHGRAPLRINDIGGWTDTWFAGKGRVQNLAVGPPVEIQLKAEPDKKKEKKRVVVIVENYAARFRFDPDQPGPAPHPLIQQAVSLAGVPPELRVEINIFSPVPPGISTGTSASVCVALIGSLFYLRGQKISLRRLAALAHKVETERLRQQCGIQDQLCAAYGGILFIQMDRYPQSKVNRLSLDFEIRQELERRLCLIYLGRPHLSTNLHEQIIERLEKKETSLLPLEKMAALAEKAKETLEKGDLKAYGEVMIENTEWQRRLGADLISAEADRVIAIAKKYRAEGWKVNGAGGEGGSMTVLASSDDRLRRQMLEAIGNLGRGIRPLPAYLSSEGFVAWEGS